MFYDSCSLSTISKSPNNNEKKNYNETDVEFINDKEYLLLKEVKNDNFLNEQCPSYSYHFYDKTDDLNDQTIKEKSSNKSFNAQVCDSLNDTKKISSNVKTWSVSPKINSNISTNFNKSNKSTPLKNNNLLGKSMSCHRCTKIVYEAEKVIGAGNIWHKTCFRCLFCGKSLEPGKFCDREECYAKNFGPKGVGCGIGAGILQMHQ